MPDMSATTAPKSEQLDNLELRDGPQVFTITRVDLHIGSDQPLHVHLAEFPRPWKPGKNQRRVLKHCWGSETDDWIGKRVELYADVTVKFGNETPGGTRIKRLSGITKTEHAPQLLGQGKPGTYKVEPLPDAPTQPQLDDATRQRIADLREEWKSAEPERNAEIQADVASLQGGES